MNFKVGDIVVPTCNNMEILDDPTPRYRIYQIGMGRVLAENMLTGETCDLASGFETVDYYYELESAKDYKKDYTLVEAIAEVYNFNPRKKCDSQIIFEVTDEDEPDTWIRFGKHWDKFEHKWTFTEQAKNCPCLGCEERHFVSNLMANGFAKSQMIYGAQQGTFKVRKVCDTRIDNAWHHELRR